MQSAAIKAGLTLEEYIDLEKLGQLRHEYYHRKIFAMPGETLLHNEICIKFLMLLRTLLLPNGWEIYMGGVKVKIENEEIYLYPDIVVKSEASLKSEPFENYIIYNPLLIAEVLSDSTRKYDSIDKFIQYQKISTLHYYLLIEPEKQVVIFYQKSNTGEWTGKVFTDAEETINFPLLGGRISLADIYAK